MEVTLSKSKYIDGCVESDTNPYMEAVQIATVSKEIGDEDGYKVFHQLATELYAEGWSTWRVGEKRPDGR